MFRRLNQILLRILWKNRCISTDTCLPRKSVWISTSKDIYTNLALEDWLYQKHNFDQHHILMLWQNDSCVVIGKHQNPWLEANVSHLPTITPNGTKLARRNSGGGTVYHDKGNLNLSFFTPRKLYNRKRNLELITRALQKNFNLSLEITNREDLVIDDFKVSGTASRLGKDTAYHHCTLLVNTNKENLRKALEKRDLDIETNATKSIRSKIMNICECNSEITTDLLVDAISREYTDSLSDCHLIDPKETLFPGLDEIRDQFRSMSWRFGKTPKFTFKKSIPELALNISVLVENGKISKIDSLDSTLNDNFISRFGSEYFSENIIDDYFTNRKDNVVKKLKS